MTDKSVRMRWVLLDKVAESVDFEIKQATRFYRDSDGWNSCDHRVEVHTISLVEERVHGVWFAWGRMLQELAR